jgi:hypothetical protein
VSESVILANLEYKAKKLRNNNLFFNQKLYSPDKINVNPDFIKSNYLTCSNQNVKKTITKIYDGKQMIIHHQSCK